MTLFSRYENKLNVKAQLYEVENRLNKVLKIIFFQNFAYGWKWSMFQRYVKFTVILNRNVLRIHM